MKNFEVFSGVCFLSSVGEKTELKDYKGKHLFTGDLVAVVENNNWKNQRSKKNKEFIFRQYRYNVQIVVKDDFKTTRDLSTNKLTHKKVSNDAGWIFGWRTSDFSGYKIIKLKSYKDIEKEYSHSNFRVQESNFLNLINKEYAISDLIENFS